jgi:pterin-4a-carbinolamine dehydratase
MMEQAFERQVLFLSDTTDSASFFNHWPEVRSLETLWTRVVIQGHRDPVTRRDIIDY